MHLLFFALITQVFAGIVLPVTGAILSNECLTIIGILSPFILFIPIQISVQINADLNAFGCFSLTMIALLFSIISTVILHNLTEVHMGLCVIFGLPLGWTFSIILFALCLKRVTYQSELVFSSLLEPIENSRRERADTLYLKVINGECHWNTHASCPYHTSNDYQNVEIQNIKISAKKKPFYECYKEVASSSLVKPYYRSCFHVPSDKIKFEHVPTVYDNLDYSDDPMCYL